MPRKFTEALSVKLRSIPRLMLKAVGLTVGSFFKGLLLTLVMFLVLAGAAFVGFRAVFDEERLRSLMAAGVSEILRRPVQIQGLVLTPSGMKLRGVRVFTGAGPEAGILLDSEFVLATVKFMPLVFRRLELRQLKFSNPIISVSRSEKGFWGIADLFVSSSPASHRGGSVVDFPFRLAAERTVIENGRLAVDDRLEGRKFIINKFNLAIDDFDLNRLFSFSASFDNLNTFEDREVSSSWELEGALHLASGRWDEASADFRRLKLITDGQEAGGSLSVKGFLVPTVTWDLSLPSLGPDHWARYTGRREGPVLPKSRWMGRLSSPEPKLIRFEKLEASLGGLTLSAVGLLDWSRRSPRFDATLAFSDFQLTKAVELSKSFARYRLGGTATGRVAVSGWLGDLTVHEAQVDAKGFKGEFEHHRILNGAVNFSATHDFDKVNLVVKGGEVTAFANVFSDISASIKLAGKDMRLERLNFKWAGSPGKIKARIKDISDPKEVMVSGEFDRVQWDQAQRLVNTLSDRLPGGDEAPEQKKSKPWLKNVKYAIPKKFPNTLGQLTIKRLTQEYFDCADVEVIWNLKGISPSLNKLQGEVKVGFGPGRVADIPAVQKSHNTLRLIFLPFIYMHKMNNLAVLSAKTAYPKTLDFNRIEGEYGLKEGVLSTRYFFVDSPQLVVFADGDADFGRETVDMRILTRLTGYRGQLPEWWVDEAGRPAIGFRVKGNINDADVEPRLRKIAANEIEEVKEEGVRKARAEFVLADKLREL